MNGRKRGDEDSRQRSAVQEIYNQDPDYYVTSSPHASSGSLHRAAELLATYMGRHLDVATGAGHTAFAVAASSRHVIASDLTHGMLLAARRLAAERGVENVSFLRADAEALPARAGSLDSVSVRIAPHHFNEPRRFLAEAARVLRAGGRLVYVDNVAPDDAEDAVAYNRFEQRRDPSHHRCDATRTLIRWMQECGLHLLHCENLRKRISFDNWVRRPNLDDAERAELRAFLESASGGLKAWLQPRVEEGELVFDEVEAILLVERPISE